MLVTAVSLLDINECIKGSQNCRLGETCINTVGSFRCQRDSSCGTGYELTEDNDCKGITGSESGDRIPPPRSRDDVMGRWQWAPRVWAPWGCAPVAALGTSQPRYWGRFTVFSIKLT